MNANPILRPPRARAVTWTHIAVACTIGAAGIHLGAVREHMAEWLPAGAFMVISGLAQLAWALWFARSPRRWLLEVGIAGNTAIIALWIVSRTSGLPTGPMPWTPEEIHGTDLIATALEAFALIALVALAVTKSRRPDPFLVKLAALGLAAVVLAPGHDPARERLAFVATMAVAGIWLAASPRVRQAYHTRIIDWRSHDKNTSRHPAVLRSGIAVGAGLGDSR